MNQPIELSLEQEFHLKSFVDQVQRMSREQAQEFLIMIHQQIMIQETMYQHFLMHEWNLDSGTVFK
jgi:Phycobilisome degradation protein nblA